MAVDMIARLMAMGNSGGTADVYTKDETDTLLAAKAATTYVDGIADMVIDKMQLWADYIADYDTAMLAKQATLDMSNAEKKQQFAMQKVHLQKLKSKYAYLQAYYEQHGELPETVTFDSITNACGCMYRTESDGEVKVAVLKGSANGMIVDSPDFTATASTSDATRTVAHQTSGEFGIEISGYGWISVSIETTGTLFSSFNWSGYPSGYTAWWGVRTNGSIYIPVITGTRNINAYTFDNGILFSMPENTVDAETPWDYYNNYVLPDLAAGNAAFPTGYTPTTPKAKFYTKDETDELLEGKQDALTFDDVPTSLSNNPVKSDGIYRKLRQKEDAILTIFDSGTMTNDTVIADTGVGIDIPADGSYYQVTGCITWKGSPPTEAQLRVKFGVRSSDYLMARATNANDDNKNFMYLPVGCTFKADPYYPDDADTTIHVSVWGKTAAATGECDVCLVARRISNGFTT